MSFAESCLLCTFTALVEIHQVASITPSPCTGCYRPYRLQVAAKDCRWAVGCVLAEDADEPDARLQQTLKDNGYTITALPKVDEVVHTWFPFRNRLSIYLAIYRVWNALGAYMKVCSVHALKCNQIQVLCSILNTLCN